MAQPSHNSLGSVLPQLGPLCSTIHSPGSWVRWPEPSWILSLGFIGWQLIYPLYTFQIIGLSLQGRKEEPHRVEKKTRFESSALPPEASPNSAACCINVRVQRAAGVLRERSILVPEASPAFIPGLPQEARCSARGCFIFHAADCRGILGGQLWDTDRPVCTGCYGNQARSVATLQRTSCAAVPLTYSNRENQERKKKVRVSCKPCSLLLSQPARLISNEAPLCGHRCCDTGKPLLAQL